MANIKLVLLGDTYPLDADKLVKLANRFSTFKVVKRPLEIVNPSILNDPQIPMLISTFKENNDIQNIPLEGANFTVLVIARPLEGNFFSIPISEKLIVVSIFDIDNLNLHEGITPEMFLCRFLLGFSTVFQAYGGLTKEGAELFQKNSRGCLFDQCLIKPEVVKFFRNPSLSDEAKTILNRKVDKNFIDDVKKDIKKLEIGMYYKLRDWFKENPILAIVITFIVQQLVSESTEMIKGYLYGLL
jgi:hypothetical protein